MHTTLSIFLYVKQRKFFPYIFHFIIGTIIEEFQISLKSLLNESQKVLDQLAELSKIN